MSTHGVPQAVLILGEARRSRPRVSNANFRLATTKPRASSFSTIMFTTRHSIQLPDNDVASGEDHSKLQQSNHAC